MHACSRTSWESAGMLQQVFRRQQNLFCGLAPLCSSTIASLLSSYGVIRELELSHVPPLHMARMTCGLVADTHGVFDEALAEHFRGASAIIHAGDIGHHGRSAAIVEHLSSIAPVTAVRGNVDDDAEGRSFPESAVLELGGWRVLVTHVGGMPPKVTAATAALVAQHRPDIVVFGHSHVHGCKEEGGVLFVNPGSAGPARFKLGRSAALLELPPKGSGEQPVVRKVELAAKAPPRLGSSAPAPKRQRRGQM